MKRFCDDFKKHVTRIINYETKPMIALTKEEESYKNQELCHACEYAPILITMNIKK